MKVIRIDESYLRKDDSHMELRVLQYFLAIAREQSISGAAEYLHLSQPTLSRQIREMEEELGKQLLIRGNRKVTLTQEGMILRKRAEEIIDLVQKTEHEITLSDDTITGDVYIGTGETEGVRQLARVARELQKDYPGIHYHIVSGDSVDIMERLDKGLFDFAILLDPADISKYESIRLPYEDITGVLMRKDCPFAGNDTITMSDLTDLPLIVSRQQRKNGVLDSLKQQAGTDLNVVASYNLIFNASLMVEEGLGYAIGLDKIINTTGNTNLIFKPLSPQINIGMSFVWKKYQIFSKAAEILLLKMQESLH
jgi:DNA-binding transcriptional LysR family regulator